MSKHIELSEQEFQSFNMNKTLQQVIENYRKKNGLNASEVSILDFGCGRGRLVLRLREQGYSAFGVDVDEKPISNGIKLFSDYGYNGRDLMKVVGIDCKTDFNQNEFDIIVSEQVIEHVENIDMFIEEIGRLTKKGGMSFHQFPSKYHFTEQHLYMPLIHWLPKNSLRKLLVTFWMNFGKDPKWPELKGKPSKLRIETYYNYSIQKTFYRTKRFFRKRFRLAGFKPTITSLSYPLRINKRMFSLNAYFAHTFRILAKKDS